MRINGKGKVLLALGVGLWLITRGEEKRTQPAPTEAGSRKYTDPNGHEWLITFDTARARWVARAQTGHYAGETNTKPLAEYPALVQWIDNYAKANATPE